jgi:hypothetical protein
VAQSTQQVPGNQAVRRSLSDRVDGRQTPVRNQAGAMTAVEATIRTSGRVVQGAGVLEVMCIGGHQMWR